MEHRERESDGEEREQDKSRDVSTVSRERCINRARRVIPFPRRRDLSFHHHHPAPSSANPRPFLPPPPSFSPATASTPSP